MEFALIERLWLVVSMSPLVQSLVNKQTYFG